ncbi:MAG: TonB-dependent receptor [Gemmatimonadetes bacterium]|nr:TonB-dependent receptor [Gemmatimonadota bacterium]MYB99059.1 TonB-dependent receptor [Gemmatimonadota bacterium]MYI44815.1 TonB-dependent receptor [Gemmatimonadota bacterium]
MPLVPLSPCLASPAPHRIRYAGGFISGLLVALMGVTTVPAAAQTGSVQGLVLDGVSRRPLADAQVHVVGTGIGLLTNSAGRFVLLGVPAGEQVVRVSVIGYGEVDTNVTVTVDEVVSLEIEMTPTAISLDEIVVTGVGAETQRRALGTTVEVLTAEDFELAPVQSLDQVLQGRVPGATVSATSAQPGTGSLINFRGVSSVFGAQTPVIYIDGVRVDNDQATSAGTGGEQSSALADLLTTDIERIEITRGGAASTLFGADAATGVIQVFTRKGSPGAPRVTARMEHGLELPELKYIFDTRVIFTPLVDSGFVSPTFMEDNYFKRGTSQNYYLGVSGGTADVTYSVSGRLEDRTGTQPSDGSTNYSLRGGLQASVTDDFAIDFSGSYVRHNFQRLFNGAAIPDPLTTFEVGDALAFSGTSTLAEALDIFLLPEIGESVNRFILSGGVRWNIGDNLSTRLTVGADNRSNQQRVFQPIGFTPGEPTGQLNRRDRSFTSVSVDAGTTYSWQNTGGSIASSLTVGLQGFREEESIINANGRGFALPGTTDFDAAAVITAFEGNVEVFNGGLYVDEQLSLRDKLYLGAGFRIDAGSSFGDEIDTELYPKATVSYVLSDGMSIPFVDEFKLRTAFGQTGKFPGAFLKDRTFSATPFRSESAPRFANPGNAELRPEKTSTIEVGFDAALWSNRAGLDVTVYDARTTDALFQVPRQPVTGLGTQQENVGEIWNFGVETTLNVQVLNTRRLAWSVGGHFQFNHNQVTDMGGVPAFPVGGLRPQQWVTGCWKVEVEGDLDTCIGGPVGAWFVTMPADTNGDSLPDATIRQFSGKGAVPTRSGGLNTTLSVGNNLAISALADWAGGHQVFDWGSVWATFNGILRRQKIRCGIYWINPVTDTRPPEERDEPCAYAFPLQYNHDGTVRGEYSEAAARNAFLYDGDYFKLREVSVRYFLPESFASRVGASRATLYLSARNLWIWSRNRLIDGELNGVSFGGGLQLGSESSVTLSPNRMYRLGVEVVF